MVLLDIKMVLNILWMKLHQNLNLSQLSSMGQLNELFIAIYSVNYQVYQSHIFCFYNCIHVNLGISLPLKKPLTFMVILIAFVLHSFYSGSVPREDEQGLHLGPAIILRLRRLKILYVVILGIKIKPVMRVTTFVTKNAITVIGTFSICKE